MRLRKWREKDGSPKRERRLKTVSMVSYQYYLCLLFYGFLSAQTGFSGPALLEIRKKNEAKKLEEEIRAENERRGILEDVHVDPDTVDWLYGRGQPADDSDTDTQEVDVVTSNRWQDDPDNPDRIKVMLCSVQTLFVFKLILKASFVDRTMTCP